MTTTKKRSSSPNAVAKTALEQATLALKDLPDKPRDVWSLKEAVEFMREPITVALNKGYSYEEVAGMLHQNGVDIRTASLKYYLTAIKRDTELATKPKTRRARKTRTSSDDQTPVASVEMPTPEVVALSDIPSSNSLNGASTEVEAAEPTPAKRRPRSTTNARSATKATTATKTAAKTKTTTGAKSRATAKPKSTSAKSTTTKTTPGRRRKKSDASPE